MIISVLILSIIISLVIVYFNYWPLSINILWQFPLWFVIIFLSIFLLIILMIIVLSVIIQPEDKTSRASRFLRAMNIYIAKTVNVIFGLRIKTYNLDLLPEDSKYMIVSNHQSNLDPLILISILKNPDLIMIMKDNMMKVPFISRWLVSAGFLPLNRDNNREALKTILEGNSWVESGRSLGVYPEGTRSKKTELLPFKNGVFKIALKAECPIVVCTTDGMHKVKKNFPLVPTRIFFKVSKVIPYEEIKDLNTNEIGAMVHTIMTHDLEHARKEISWLKKEKTRVK